MARIYFIGTFSSQGVKGLMTSDTDREDVVKKPVIRLEQILFHTIYSRGHLTSLQ